MKHKDYIRLSKISLKSRKKTTKSTVRGISFGLILLLPLLFIIMAFHVDLNKQVNKDPSIRIFNISYVNKTTDDSYVQNMLESNSEEIYSIDGISNILKYNTYTFTNRIETYDYETNQYIDSGRLNVTIDGKTITLDKDVKHESEYGNREASVNLQVIDPSIGNNIFLKSDYEVLESKQPLVYGNVFSSNDSSKEVMVSTNFINKYDLGDDIVGKKISLSYIIHSSDNITTSKTSIDNDFDVYNNIPVNIFNEYTIVGVFDSNIYKSSSRYNSILEHYGDNNTTETYFWLTTDSVYTSMDKFYIPEPITVEREYSDGSTNMENAYYYQDDLMEVANRALSDKVLFIPLGMGAKIYHDGQYLPVYSTLIEFESYSDANNAVKMVETLYKETSTSTEEINVSQSYMNDTFLNYRMFYNLFTYVTIVLAIFGGIVFFATLLNLYNTIHYSVQSRRNYLGLCRAIGMKNREVTKLYFTEVFQIFKRSYIWTAIFGGGICGGICFLFKMIMQSDVGQIITFDLTLNPIFILLAFILLIIINTIISIGFSLIACHNVSNKPILEVLVENR